MKFLSNLWLFIKNEVHFVYYIIYCLDIMTKNSQFTLKAEVWRLIWLILVKYTKQIIRSLIWFYPFGSGLAVLIALVVTWRLCYCMQMTSRSKNKLLNFGLFKILFKNCQFINCCSTAMLFYRVLEGQFKSF